MADPVKDVFEQVRHVLFSAKFAIEQDLSITERFAVIQEIRDTLDALTELEKTLLKEKK